MKAAGAPPRSPDWSQWVAGGLAVVAIVATIPVRFVISRGQPLWLDETWTAAIAAQPGWAGFWRQVYLDVNAPLYYLFVHLWQGLFGLSDASLRLPSALFGAAAPLAIALAPVSGLSRPGRLTWAALTALWIPGLYLAGEARGYTLLLLLCTLSLLAFLRLLDKPGTGRAALWAGLASLAILTHYHALILAGLQGLAYLARSPRKALRTWPAALLFVPAFAWLAWHSPRIAQFARPGVAWYPLLRLSRVGAVFAYPFGSDTLAWELLALAVVAGVAALAAWRVRRSPITDDRLGSAAPLWIASGTAVAGALLIIGLGFLRPSFTTRYLVPFVPGVLLGLAILPGRMGRGGNVVLAMTAALFAWAAVPWAQTELSRGWRVYNWEVASTDLMRLRPARLLFIWDHPASPILAPDQLEAVGGFFFRRAHAPVQVSTIVLPADQDPNPRLLAALQDPGLALIWAYDRGVVGTAARRFPPRLDQLDPTLDCRNYGRGSVGVLACDRQGSLEKGRP